MVGSGDIPITTQIREVIDRATVAEGEVLNSTVVEPEPDVTALESLDENPEPEAGDDPLFGGCMSEREVENALREILQNANSQAEIDDLRTRAADRLKELGEA